MDINIFINLFKRYLIFSFTSLQSIKKIFFEEIRRNFSLFFYRFNCKELDKSKEFKYVVIDGVGFGFNNLYPMKIEKRIREIKSHIPG